VTTHQEARQGLTRFSVEGKSVLITGATGALGRVAARALAEAGARLTLAGGNAAGLAELVRDAGIDGAALVTRRPETPADAQAMVEAAVARHGRLDGVLVASGMNHVAPITEMDVTDFDKVVDANLRGAWLVSQAAGRVLLEQGDGGSVVLVSSVRGALGHSAGYSAYCPSKAGTDLLAKSLAAEWGPCGIRVNALAPTVFRSELTEWMYADDEQGRRTREAMFARIPLGRFAEPEDFVGALIYLMTTQPQMADIASTIGAIGRSAGKPTLLVLSAGSVADNVRAKLREAGNPYLDRLDDALRVLRALADHAEAPRAPGGATEPLGPTAVAPIVRLPAGPLTTPEALALVAAAGVPVAAATTPSSSSTPLRPTGATMPNSARWARIALITPVCWRMKRWRVR